MSNGTRINVDGIEYSVFVMGENNHGRGTVLALNKIGRGGKPTKAERPALLKPDGTIELGRWL